jgi:MFS family permease
VSVAVGTPARGADPALAGPDRHGLTMLAAGHFVIDMCVGALPALLPVFTALYALSDLGAAMILAASLLASSAIQPLFGILADRRASPAFLWGGVAVGAIGLAAAGLAGGYAGVLACIVGSGLGIAAFHPEAARVANRIAGERTASGLAWFMVGGNAGFAAGPLVPLLLVQRGYSEGFAGMMVFWFAAAGALGTVAGAAVADRVGGRRMLIVSLPVASPLVAGLLVAPDALGLTLFALSGFVLMASFSVTVAMGQEYMPGRLALAAGLMIGFGAIGSAPPGLALFGAIADAAGREAAVWGLAAVPLAGAALAVLLPGAPRTRPRAVGA